VTSPDASRVDGLADAVAALVPALERFASHVDGDLAASEHGRWEAALDVPLPDDGIGLEAVMEQLADDVVPHGNRQGAPGFSGWVVNEPTTAGAAAVLATTISGTGRGGTQAHNLLEAVALRWIAELLDLPAAWQGLFVSGGATANLIGLGAARQHAFEAIGHDVATQGLPPASPRVYASAEAHHVVHRACAVLGLGREAIRLVDVDRLGRVDPRALAAAIASDRRAGSQPVAIVASTGTVNAGVIDPLSEIADVADAEGVWLHVDGAYGLWGRLDERVAARYAGIERAGSVVVDPHKWLAAPVGIGAVFVRDRGLLTRAFHHDDAAYLDLFRSGDDEQQLTSQYDRVGRPFRDFGLELTAPSRGTLVWATLLEIGARGMRERVQRHLDYARRLADLVRRDERLELMQEPELSICVFRYAAPGLDDAALDDLTTRIARRLRAEGRTVPTTTTIRGRHVLRPCFINPRTPVELVDELAASVRRIGDELVG
jgi:aromatic-L-amino-acid decarboxylase